MPSCGSDDPRDITVVLQTSKGSLVEDLGIVRLNISSLIGLVVTTEEQIVVVCGLGDRIDSRHFVELCVPPDSTISLVESNDGAKTSVPTDQVELGLLLRVRVDEVCLFFGEQGDSCDLSCRKLDKLIVPIDSNAVVILRIRDSEQEHGFVLDKSCVEIGLVISVVAFVVVDGAMHHILGHGIGVRLDGLERHETVEVAVSGIDIHHQGNLVSVALEGERGAITRKLATVDLSHGVGDVVEEVTPLPVSVEVQSEEVAVIVGRRGEIL